MLLRAVKLHICAYSDFHKYGHVLASPYMPWWIQAAMRHNWLLNVVRLTIVISNSNHTTHIVFLLTAFHLRLKQSSIGNTGIATKNKTTNVATIPAILSIVKKLLVDGSRAVEFIVDDAVGFVTYAVKKGGKFSKFTTISKSISMIELAVMFCGTSLNITVQKNEHITD